MTQDLPEPGRTIGFSPSPSAEGAPLLDKLQLPRLLLWFYPELRRLSSNPLFAAFQLRREALMERTRLRRKVAGYVLLVLVLLGFVLNAPYILNEVPVGRSPINTFLFIACVVVLSFRNITPPKGMPNRMDVLFFQANLRKDAFQDIARLPVTGRDVVEALRGEAAMNWPVNFISLSFIIGVLILATRGIAGPLSVSSWLLLLGFVAIALSMLPALSWATWCYHPNSSRVQIMAQYVQAAKLTPHLLMDMVKLVVLSVLIGTAIVVGLSFAVMAMAVAGEALLGLLDGLPWKVLLASAQRVPAAVWTALAVGAQMVAAAAILLRTWRMVRRPNAFQLVAAPWFDRAMPMLAQAQAGEPQRREDFEELKESWKAVLKETKVLKKQFRKGRAALTPTPPQQAPLAPPLEPTSSQ